MNIEEAAARRLAAGARSVGELSGYLAMKGFDEGEISRLIERLQQDGYLDDRRYAEDFYRYAFDKGWGRARADRELARRGVESDIRNEAFAAYAEEFGFDEEAKALRVIRKMIAPGDLDEGGAVPDKLRARAARRLFSYGYGRAAIYAAIDRAAEEMAAERAAAEAAELSAGAPAGKEAGHDN